MVTVKLLDRNQTFQVVNDKPDTPLSREVQQFLAEASRNPSADRPQPGYMAYRVPFPGVRYYSFQAR